MLTIDNQIKELTNNLPIKRGKWYEIKVMVKPIQRSEEVLVDDVKVFDIAKYRRVEVKKKVTKPKFKHDADKNIVGYDCYLPIGRLEAIVTILKRIKYQKIVDLIHLVILSGMLYYLHLLVGALTTVKV